MFGILELFVLTSLLLGSVSAQKASVSIEPGSSPDVRGLLNIAVVDSGVMITGRITGLTPGLHGFHIHEKGDLGNACKNAGPHFNPFQLAHGDPKSPQRHVGDLGNIVADASGTAFIDIFDDRASMDPNSQAYIGNRAIVVHASPDDLGRGFDEESKKTGNAGARVGCGLINIDLTSQSPYPFQGYPMQVPGRNIDQIQPAHVIPFQIQQQDTLGSRLVPSIGASSISPGLGAIGNVLIIPGSSNTVQGQLEVADVTGGITIRGSISGLTPGLHGFHIHEKGELGNQCRDALGHFNPFNLNHGDPRDFERHVGDLGNIEAGANGVAYIDIFDPKASLSPRSLAYVGNRAMVVHAAPDDLGRGPNEESLKTGNAGARVGCGVIEVRPSSSSFHREIQRPITFPFGLPTYNQPIRPYQPYQPYGFLF